MIIENKNHIQLQFDYVAIEIVMFIMIIIHWKKYCNLLHKMFYYTDSTQLQLLNTCIAYNA